MGNGYREVKNKITQLWWKVKDNKLEDGFEDFLEFLTEDNKKIFIENKDELMVAKYKLIEKSLKENKIIIIKIKAEKIVLTQKIEAMVDLLYEELKVDNDFSKIYDFYYELKEDMAIKKRSNIDFNNTKLLDKIDYIFAEEKEYRVRVADGVARQINTSKIVFVDDNEKINLYEKKHYIENTLLDIPSDIYTKKIREVLSFISAIEANNQRIIKKQEKKQREDNLRKIREEKERLEKEEQERLKKEKEEQERLRVKAKEEQKRKEEEKRRLEAEKLQKIKDVFENLKVNQMLNEDYLNADEKVEKKLKATLGISFEIRKSIEEKYKNEKVTFIKNWISKNTGNRLKTKIELDDEQAKAVGAVGSNYLVSARAGSGKTRVLISRAFFLIKHCNIPANEILILAFNKKAVQEVNKRLIELLGSNLPVVQTFHALAYKIVKLEENLLFDQEHNKTHTVFIDKLVKEFTAKNENIEVLKEVMLTDFGDDWNLLLQSKYAKDYNEVLKYRRSLVYQSIDGKFIKSYGEKLTCNFLFEHNIEYYYERNHTWNGLNYKPDFTILFDDKRSGVVIEYFGMEGEKNYDITTEEKIKYWNEKEGWELIQIYPKDINGNLEKLLTNHLNRNGIKCERLSEKDIWKKIKDPTIKSFTNIVKSFIGQCRKLEIDPLKLQGLIDSYQSEDEIELKFYSLCKTFYMDYLNLLKRENEEDFDGLLERAIAKIKSSDTSFGGFSEIGEEKVKVEGDIKHLKYIFIDEFQDFSKLFYSLILAIKNVNKGVELFCVGDDWQAINGFAGSDLAFFKLFNEVFDNTKKLNISRNYRSRRGIVDIGNKLQMGMGKEAVATTVSKGSIKVVHIEDYNPTLLELRRHKGDYITPLVLRIINKNIKAGKKVMLISRKNSLPYYTSSLHSDSRNKNNDLKDFLESIRSQITEEKRHMITINTAHKSKGLEEQAVILLDVNDRSYPLIHPHWKYSKILGNSIKKIVDEERRLLYVGLTRAEDKLYIITGKSSKSQMLVDIEQKKKLDKIDLSEYTPLIPLDDDKKRILVRVENSIDKWNQYGGTKPIKDILKKYNYTFNGKDIFWEKISKNNNFNIENLQNEKWVEKAKNVDVVLRDDEDKEIKRFKIGSDGSIREIKM